MSLKIWFHGTDEKSADQILKYGFRSCTYFAAHLEDAIEFGGEHILEVALDVEESRAKDWQIKYAEPVSPNAIVSYAVYSRVVYFENQKLIDKIFEANVGSEDEIMSECDETREYQQCSDA